MIVPKRNEKDLPDIPEEVRETLKFHFVENTDEVLAIALGQAAARERPATADHTDRDGAKPKRTGEPKESREPKAAKSPDAPTPARTGRSKSRRATVTGP